MVRLDTVSVLLALLMVTASADMYKKIATNADPDAKCLDGSSPIIYLHEGGDTKNIMFYFIGGGACMGTDLASTLESCYRRSKGMFGTSTVWPETYDATEGGLLAVDSNKSRFANWTKIVIMYCDGSFHQGNNKSPIQYKDRQLYFRGAVNTRSHIKWANDKYNLSKAEKIIVSGSSAGGIATYLWVDYVRSLVPNPRTVYGVADSGIFYDPLVKSHLTIEENRKFLNDMFARAEMEMQGMNDELTAINEESSISDPDPNPIEILMKLSNVDEVPPNKECTSVLTPQQHWKCLFIQFSYPTLKYPILFVESGYDQFVIEDSLNIKCLAYGPSGYTLSHCSNLQMDAIELYHSLYLERFVPNLLKWGHSLWTISCSWHAQIINTTIYDSDLQRAPKQNGPTIRTAVQEFVYEDKRILAIDLFPWPANTPCS